MKKILICVVVCFLLFSCENSETTKTSGDHNTEIIEMTIAHQEEKDILKDQIQRLESQLQDEKNTNKALSETIVNLNVQMNEGDEEVQDLVNDMDLEMLILRGNSKAYSYVNVEPSVAYSQRLYILGSGEFLDQMTSQDQREVLHLGEGSEVASFHIYGTVYNFQWAMVTWDEAITEYTIEAPKHLISSISDTTVYIHTTIPEGLPFEVVSMENESGDNYEFLLSYDGYGLNGEVIAIEE